jgi:hypothetical protein
MADNLNLAQIGAALYICEGTKARILRTRKNQKIFAVEFTNTDPRVITIFLQFLRKIIKADENRIKAELFIYPDHNKNQLKTFWSKTTNIPPNRFQKTICLKQKNLKYKPNPLGILKIRYTHKTHFLKIQDLINAVFGSEMEYNISTLGEVA